MFRGCAAGPPFHSTPHVPSKRADSAHVSRPSFRKATNATAMDSSIAPSAADPSEEGGSKTATPSGRRTITFPDSREIMAGISNAMRETRKMRQRQKTVRLQLPWRRRDRRLTHSIGDSVLSREIWRPYVRRAAKGHLIEAECTPQGHRQGQQTKTGRVPPPVDMALGRRLPPAVGAAQGWRWKSMALSRGACQGKGQEGKFMPSLCPRTNGWPAEQMTREPAENKAT